MIKKFIASAIINSSRNYLDDFAKEAALSVPEGALVLDAGAGHCPYKHHFSDATYESADFCEVDKKYGDITYVCDLTSVPVEDMVNYGFRHLFFMKSMRSHMISTDIPSTVLDTC
ncbi:MAG: hypothetical protein ACYTBX_04500 [Planctomycetota bacterium]|jgi:hypothetical protein